MIASKLCRECDGKGMVKREIEFQSTYLRGSYIQDFVCPICKGCGLCGLGESDALLPAPLGLSLSSVGLVPHNVKQLMDANEEFIKCTQDPYYFYSNYVLLKRDEYTFTPVLRDMTREQFDALQERFDDVVVTWSKRRQRNHKRHDEHDKRQ